ncbi:MAG: MFS transporter [Candidatus Nealsonbacteria bacterium]|nr:MFS transporter [Candidatus Nealsonbacteria bacterium]
MKRNILLLGATTFINDVSSKIILPILPLFIAEIGGGGLAVGLISGLGESIASILKMLAGYFSDRIGRRKPFIIAGYFLASSGKFLFAFANLWPHVLVLRVIERFGNGLRTAPVDAVLAASSPKEKRGRGFGFHRAMDSGGAVAGALVAFVLFWYLGFAFSKIFLVAGIIGFFSLPPLFALKEKPADKKPENLKLGFRYLSPSLRFFIIIATVFALGNFSYMFFVLKSQAYFTGKLAVAAPIILYALYNLSYSLLAVPAGALSDKIGRRKVLMVGYALFGFVCLGFIFSQSLFAFILFFILFGLNYAFVNATERAFVSDLSDQALRGTALGTFHMWVSFAALPAGLIAGFLWDLNSSYPFFYGAGTALATVALFFLLVKNGKMTADGPSYN